MKLAFRNSALSFVALALITINATAIESVESDRFIINTEINEDLSSEYFGMIEFNIENKTDKWVNIKSVTLDIPNEKIRNSAKVITGEELYIWSKAIEKRNKKQAFFESLVWGSIAAFGGLSGNESVQKASTVVLGTSLTAAALNSANEDANAIDHFPKNHLLNRNAKVPPGLFVDRWILLNTTDHKKNGLLKKIKLSLELEDGTQESFEITLFSGYANESRSWQQSLFKKQR